MRIAVKYCGGCNPRYRRGAMVERLRRGFTGIEVAAADESGPQTDLLVVICGCPSACAGHGHLSARHGTLVLVEGEAYEGLAARVGEIFYH